MDETFQVDGDPYKGIVEVEQYNDDAGVLVFVFRLLTSDVPEDAAWDHVLSDLKRFLKYVKRTHRRYHFVFDTHRCALLPLRRLKEFQDITNTKPSTLDACLVSSVAIVQNRAVEAMLRMALQVVPPRRPVDILQCTPCDGACTHGVPQPTWGATAATMRAQQERV